MQNVLELFFDPHTGDGDVAASKITPLLEGKLVAIEAYLGRVPDTYISMPSMFTTEVEDTTIAEGRALQPSRMSAWRQSNRNHAMMTLEELLHGNNSVPKIIEEDEYRDGRGRKR
jgi:hypothetical protein